MRPESSPWMIRQEALFRSMSYPISSDLSSLKTPDCPVCSRGVRQIQMFPCVGSIRISLLPNVGLKRSPLLGKGGVDAPSRKIPVPMKGADGVVRSNSKTISLERTTPSAMVASRYFLNGRSHPSFAKEGTSLQPHVRQQRKRILPRACARGYVLRQGAQKGTFKVTRQY